MKILKLLLPTIVLLMLIMGLSLFIGRSADSHGQFLGIRPASTGIAQDDGPWDPGDENDPHPHPHRTSIGAPHKAVLLCKKKSDGPWDPGDESPMSTGVDHG